MHIRHSFQTYLKCHGQIFQMFSTTQATTTETAAAAAITAANSREKKNDTTSNRYTYKCCKNVCLDLIVNVLFFFVVLFAVSLKLKICVDNKCSAIAWALINSSNNFNST